MNSVHKYGRQDDCAIPGNRTLAIFMVSVWALFLEMLLIRWIGTEIRIFAYLQNTVLVVCFLGLGIGCLTSRQPIELRRSLLPLLFITLLMAVPVTRYALGSISKLLSVMQDSESIMWQAEAGKNFKDVFLSLFLGLTMTYLIMSFIVDIFVPIGRLLGRLMDEYPDTIRAYSVNVAGSLAGTWLFVLMSYFFLPPVAWIAAVALITALFLGKSGRAWKLNAALLSAMVALSIFAGQIRHSESVIWSPYQKLVLHRLNVPSPEDSYFQLNVNNTGYQAMLNLNDKVIDAHPEYFREDMRGLGQYDIPFVLHPDAADVLLVGAGSGNDAAGALRNGAANITAVEIDPAIIHLGRRYHPEHPYSSSKVRLINDDARSYFATGKDKFDVIIFGLLDSHTTTSMTNMRIDNYVYTRQSLSKAKELLKDGGMLFLSFEVRKKYIADRIAGELKEVFGEEPLSFRVPPSTYGFGGVMFVAGDVASARKRIEENPRLAALIGRWDAQSPVELNYTTRPADDDWPYIYIERPGIPSLYWFLALIMLALLVRSRVYLGGENVLAGHGRESWHFFFMGAAFLLLEVQNISKASVALGNTWDVNAVIVSGVLVMILIANLIAYRFPRMPLLPVYAVLCCTCLGLYFIDLASFAFLPYATKAFLVGGLTTLPMLFGGIIFIRSFNVVPGKDKALGANLIGAVFGALLQTVTFVTGIKALLLIVAALYIMAMLTRPGPGLEGRRLPDSAKA